MKKLMSSGTLRRNANSKSVPSSSGAGVVVAPDSRPGGRYISKLQGLNKQWPHPPEILLTASIEYTVRFLGKTEVAERSGPEVMRQALHKIQFQLNNRKADVGTAASKLPKVNIQLSIEGITIVEKTTGAITDKYPLHAISFVAVDRAVRCLSFRVMLDLQDPRVFSFIATRPTTSQYDCFVFMNSEENRAHEITLTIGEAFDLAYKQFRNGGFGGQANMEQERKLKLAERRVFELETENRKLRQMLMGTSVFSTGPPMTSAPDQPSDDMPRTPNATLIDEATKRPSLPLTPVPSTPPTSQISTPPTAARRKGPPVAPKTTVVDVIHDDSFDPRAEERAEKMREKLATASGGSKDTFGHDPFNDEFFTNDAAPDTPKQPPKIEEVKENGGEPPAVMSLSTQQQINADIAALDDEMKALSQGFTDNPLVSMDMTSSSIDMGGAALMDSLRLSNDGPLSPGF